MQRNARLFIRGPNDAKSQFRRSSLWECNTLTRSDRISTALGISAQVYSWQSETETRKQTSNLGRIKDAWLSRLGFANAASRTPGIAGECSKRRNRIEKGIFRVSGNRACWLRIGSNGAAARSTAGTARWNAWDERNGDGHDLPRNGNRAAAVYDD